MSKNSFSEEFTEFEEILGTNFGANNGLKSYDTNDSQVIGGSIHGSDGQQLNRNESQMEGNDTEEQSFGDCVQQLEAVITTAVDWIKESSEMEPNWLHRIDALVSEALHTKDITEEESKQFCTQLKQFSKFVNDFSEDITK